MLTIILYTKEGCGLCDEVKHELAGFSAAYPHSLQEVDITKDPDLFARYRFMIPVVTIGEATLRAPITGGDLQMALETAVASTNP